MDVYRKVFFDMWAFIDNPRLFPFFETVYDDGESLLKNINLIINHISPIVTLPQYRQKGFACCLINSVINTYPESDFIYVSDSVENLASNKTAQACGFSKLGHNMEIKIKNVL